jgi:DNA polymerase-3 subunit epsilon
MATTAPASPLPGEGSPDPLLYDVTFVVVDTETTGGTPEQGTLIEVAAAVYRGGARLGALDTLVDPGGPIPPFVQELTGISDAMVAGAPRLEEVMPHVGALIGDAVVVGHNVAFDIGFLDAAFERCGLAPIANACVDTLGLARRLVRDLVPDCALGTLAHGLRLDHRPSHRAMADVLATADLLHRLIELSTGFGVLRLSQLLSLPDRISPMPLESRGAIAGSFTAA